MSVALCDSMYVVVSYVHTDLVHCCVYAVVVGMVRGLCILVP